jgi:hypothetical protein
MAGHFVRAVDEPFRKLSRLPQHVSDVGTVRRDGVHKCVENRFDKAAPPPRPTVCELRPIKFVDVLYGFLWPKKEEKLVEQGLRYRGSSRFDLGSPNVTKQRCPGQVFDLRTAHHNIVPRDFKRALNPVMCDSENICDDEGPVSSTPA